MVATAFLGPVFSSFKGASALKGLALTASAWSGVVANPHPELGDSGHDHSAGGHDHADHGDHEEHEFHEDEHEDHEGHEDHGAHEEHDDHEEHAGSDVEDHEEMEDHAAHDDEIVAEEIEVAATGIKREDDEPHEASSPPEKGVQGSGSLFVGRILKATAATSLFLSAASRIIEARTKDLGLGPCAHIAASCIGMSDEKAYKEASQGCPPSASCDVVAFTMRAEVNGGIKPGAQPRRDLKGLIALDVI